ncbi:MAG: DsrE family protein, partial [Caulobacteraceae bacterium]
SPALQAIGGLLNTYRKYGVPADHIHATAVFHGDSILLVTSDETYSRRTGAAKNPNTALLQELNAAGVNLVVCGQSARAQHYATADLLKYI